MAVAEPINIESVTVRRFISKLAYTLNKQIGADDSMLRMRRRLALKNGETLTSKHEIGGVNLFLLWKGEQKFSIKTDQWSLFCNMIGLEMEGDDAAFTRDVTMLMMAADFEEADD